MYGKKNIGLSMTFVASGGSAKCFALTSRISSLLIKKLTALCLVMNAWSGSYLVTTLGALSLSTAHANTTQKFVLHCYTGQECKP